MAYFSLRSIIVSDNEYNLDDLTPQDYENMASEAHERNDINELLETFSF